VSAAAWSAAPWNRGEILRSLLGRQGPQRELFFFFFPVVF